MIPVQEQDNRIWKSLKTLKFADSVECRCTYGSFKYKEWFQTIRCRSECISSQGSTFISLSLDVSLIEKKKDNFSLCRN